MLPNINQNVYMPLAKLLPVILIALILLPACEGYRTAHGIVKDKASSQPLDSVLCEVLTSNTSMLTDSAGRFSVRNGMGGCMPDCKDIKVRFSKAGYQAMEATNPIDTIFYLQKQ